MSEQGSRRILILLQRPREGPEMKTMSACFRCKNFWYLNNWPLTLAEKNSQTWTKSRLSSAGKVSQQVYYCCNIFLAEDFRVKSKECILNEMWGTMNGNSLLAISAIQRQSIYGLLYNIVVGCDDWTEWNLTAAAIDSVSTSQGSQVTWRFRSFPLEAS